VARALIRTTLSAIALLGTTVCSGATAPQSIVELQPSRVTTSVDGATLVDLNPNVGTWYLLSLSPPAAGKSLSFHLENVSLKPPLRLAPGKASTLALVGADGATCELQSGDVLRAASKTGLPFAPICSGALYVRNPVAGHRTSIERVTDFLRDEVWGGDALITFVKKQVYRDAFLEKSGAVAGTAHSTAAATSGPRPARIAPELANASIVPEHLALDVERDGNALSPGSWYPLRGLSGVYFSSLAPAHMDASIRNGRQPNVNQLDAVELQALVYLVAFDLGELDLHFVLGTDHPRLDWSDRPPPSSQDPSLPGPDGIGSAAPLVTNGMVSPQDVERTVGAFTGGFKRSHGAFRYGALANRNHGSHYGFMEEGVIFSTLQPGLATVVVMDDAKVDLRTWSTADGAKLPHIRYARQNGVPLIELDPARATGIPGQLVNQWGAGNWSGSADEDLRSLRAGLCLATNGARRFILYGYFSAATPSAMARVFEAYRCDYAMHLDMNALEHTYLALYVQQGHSRAVEHLVSGMEEVDRSSGGALAPRFLSFPDDRDFFYLTRRPQP
jgi:hypothetical protein